VRLRLLTNARRETSRVIIWIFWMMVGASFDKKLDVSLSMSLGNVIDYERERLRRIRENKKQLLGLVSSLSTIFK
jgi:hypothetical protein